MLSNGYHNVPRGKVTLVITCLEMRARPETKPVPAPEGWELTRITDPQVDWYRRIFADVGADWLWFGRAIMEDDALAKILSDPKVEIYTLRRDGVDGGLLELDFRHDGLCELMYFGLTAPLIGTGAGRFLMNAAIDRVWSHPIERFVVRTCTLDSPQALGFYRRSGFVPFTQVVEVADDPRIAHGFDRALAPHVPIFDP